MGYASRRRWVGYDPAMPNFEYRGEGGGCPDFVPLAWSDPALRVEADVRLVGGDIPRAADVIWEIIRRYEDGELT
jgi:hypothetical protein